MLDTTIKPFIMSEQNKTEERKLNVQLSNFEKPMTFNEWSEKLGVSSKYIEPTKYFQGNPSSGYTPLEVSISPLERIMNFFSNIKD